MERSNKKTSVSKTLAEMVDASAGESNKRFFRKLFMRNLVRFARKKWLFRNMIRSPKAAKTLLEYSETEDCAVVTIEDIFVSASTKKNLGMSSEGSAKRLRLVLAGAVVGERAWTRKIYHTTVLVPEKDRNNYKLREPLLLHRKKCSETIFLVCAFANNSNLLFFWMQFSPCMLLSSQQFSAHGKTFSVHDVHACEFDPLDNILIANDPPVCPVASMREKKRENEEKCRMRILVEDVRKESKRQHASVPVLDDEFLRRHKKADWMIFGRKLVIPTNYCLFCFCLVDSIGVHFCTRHPELVVQTDGGILYVDVLGENTPKLHSVADAQTNVDIAVHMQHLHRMRQRRTRMPKLVCSTKKNILSAVRVYYRPGTLEICDSDSVHDMSWIDSYMREQIERSVRAAQPEKDFMCEWNKFSISRALFHTNIVENLREFILLQKTKQPVRFVVDFLVALHVQLVIDSADLTYLVGHL